MSYTRYSFWVTAVLFAGETVPTELCSSRLWPCDSAQPLDQGDRVGQRAHRKLEAFHALNPVYETLHAARHGRGCSSSDTPRCPERPRQSRDGRTRVWSCAAGTWSY